MPTSTRSAGFPTPDRSARVPRQHRREQASEADRRATGTSRVRRLVGAQVVGPARRQSAVRREDRGDQVPPVDSRRDGANMPEDELARTILTAAGGNYSNPPAGFFRRLRNPEFRAEEMSQLFMGVRMRLREVPQPPRRELDPGRLLLPRRVLRRCAVSRRALLHPDLRQGRNGPHQA